MKLHHEVRGQGPPLVLLSGFGTDLLSWSFQRDAFSARHKLLLLDNPGTGRSSLPNGPLTTRDLADQVLGLLDELGWDRVCLLGHSMGGAIAQELAINHPGRVARLVLVSTFAREPQPAIPILERWIEAVTDPFDEELMASQVFPWLYSDTFLANPNRVKATLGFLKAHPYRPSPDGLRMQLEAVRSHDSWDRLMHLKMPTLVLVGENDRLTSPDLCQELAQQIPSAQFQQISAAAHVCMIEQADRFADIVLNFTGPR